MFPFERLVVWQRAHRLAVDLHAVTAEWTDRDLQTQLRRAAQSVAANIAEGAGCDSPGQFGRYLAFAQASASEVRNHLRFSADIGVLPPSAFTHHDRETQEVRMMLHALRRRVLAQHTARMHKGAPTPPRRPGEEA